MERDARHEAVVRMLLDREVEDRQSREKRQLGYRQFLESGSAPAAGTSIGSPTRLYKFRTKVPCAVMPEAQVLLDRLNEQCSAGVITFVQVTERRQAIMLATPHGKSPRQIGYVEHCVQSDPQLCNVRHQGLQVDVDENGMLVLRFRYPSTAVRVSSGEDIHTRDVGSVEFTEVRPALDLLPSNEGAAPSLVWATRPEIETMDTLGSRDYEAFYVRFKLEVQAGIWNTLSDVLASSPGSYWHRGSYYTVVREPDARHGRINQRTVDDCGNAVDIGVAITYDASTATDIALLYLEGDILADLADICFTLQTLSAADALLLKEEFFGLIRRFWATTHSLASRYGDELPAVLRMSQRVVPTPAQALLLKHDWTTLRQALVDRYGEGGRNAAELVDESVQRPHNAPATWPFACFPTGEVNVGLRVVYRQEWVETDQSVVDEAAEATVKAMKWPRELEGSINTGVRSLAATTDMGVETEYRESSRDTGVRLTNVMRRFANSGSAITRPAEIQNVVMVAEKLPLPSDIGLGWVKLHDWIIANVLLDESFRDALDSISGDSPFDEDFEPIELDAKRERLYEHLRANILHYQRAIWQQEDPQQRSMRYRKSGRKVPLEWRFEIESGERLTVDELTARLSAPNVDGQFAAYSAGREADLDQLIDPAGPIAYYGNFAIYHMRPEFGSEDLFSMLHFFKSPYLRPHPKTGEPQVADPVEMEMEDEPVAAEAVDDEPVLFAAPSDYELIFESTNEIGVACDMDWVIMRETASEPLLLRVGPESAALAAADHADRMIVVAEEKVTLTSLPAVAADAPSDWALRARDDSQSASLVAGSRPVGNAGPSARVIVGGRTLHAGGGTAGTQGRVIVRREDRRLQPCLIAG